MNEVRNTKQEGGISAIIHYGDDTVIEGDMRRLPGGRHSICLYQTPILYRNPTTTEELADISIKFIPDKRYYRIEGPHVWLTGFPEVQTPKEELPSIYPKHSIPFEILRLPRKHEVIITVLDKEPRYCFVEAEPYFAYDTCSFTFSPIAIEGQTRSLSWKRGHIPPFKRIYRNLQITAILDIIETLEETLKLFVRKYDSMNNTVVSSVTKIMLDSFSRTLERLSRTTEERFLAATVVWGGRGMNIPEVCEELLKRSGR